MATRDSSGSLCSNDSRESEVEVVELAVSLMEAWSDVVVKRWEEPCVRAGVARCTEAILVAMSACGLHEEIGQEAAAVLQALLGDDEISFNVSKTTANDS